MYTAIYKFNYLSIVMGFTFGIMDSGTSTHVSMILGFEFGEKSVIAFGIQNCIKSCFFGIGAVVSSFTSNSWQYLIYFTCVFVLALFSYTLMYLKFPFTKRS